MIGVDPWGIYLILDIFLMIWERETTICYASVTGCGPNEGPKISCWGYFTMLPKSRSYGMTLNKVVVGWGGGRYKRPFSSIDLATQINSTDSRKPTTRFISPCRPVSFYQHEDHSPVHPGCLGRHHCQSYNHASVSAFETYLTSFLLQVRAIHALPKSLLQRHLKFPVFPLMSKTKLK